MTSSVVFPWPRARQALLAKASIVSGVAVLSYGAILAYWSINSDLLIACWVVGLAVGCVSDRGVGVLRLSTRINVIAAADATARTTTTTASVFRVIVIRVPSLLLVESW